MFGGTGVVEDPYCNQTTRCIENAYYILGDLIELDFDSKIDTPKTITGRGKNFIFY